MTAAKPDSLTPALRAVLSLFDDVLSGVRFPDVDRDGLVELAEEVAIRRTELDEAEALAARVRESLDVSLSALTTRARRGLAYARVFAEGDPTLAAHVASLTAALSPSRPELPVADAPRKRGRPRKVDTSLFLAEDTTSGGASTEESGSELDDLEAEAAQ